LKSDKD